MNTNSAESVAEHFAVSQMTAERWVTTARNHREKPEWFHAMAAWRGQSDFYDFVALYYEQSLQAEAAAADAVETAQAAQTEAATAAGVLSGPASPPAAPHRPQPLGGRDLIRQRHLRVLAKSH